MVPVHQEPLPLDNFKKELNEILQAFFTFNFDRQLSRVGELLPLIDVSFHRSLASSRNSSAMSVSAICVCCALVLLITVSGGLGRMFLYAVDMDTTLLILSLSISSKL